MEIKIYPTKPEMGAAAAADVAAAIHEALSRKEKINMIFAAAPSQSAFLASLVATPGSPWERIRAFHMDEYIGLPCDAPQGFGNFLDRHIFGLVPFGEVYYISCDAPDASEECRRYSELLRKYPVDIVCLGIGENGHIAFNDPGVADFDDPALVKIVPLDDVCRMQQVHDGCFGSVEQVPTHALTLTIPALTAAESMYCIVPCPTKAAAVRAAVQGPVTESCPASVLRTHAKSYLYLDSDSASLL